MTRTNRTLLAATVAIVAVTSIGYGWPAAGQIPAPAVEEAPRQQPVIEEAPQQPAIEIVGGTADQQKLAQWAIDRYQEAGLPLPSTRIEFHATREGCRGYLGHYSQSQGRVDVCNSDNERTEPIHTILHELAHAWSFEYLPQTTIDAFTEYRGLTAWHDTEVAWWKQSKEQAAEIVAWGLMDGDDPFLNRWVIGEPCEELADAFELLTGTAPLHDSRESCR